MTLPPANPAILAFIETLGKKAQIGQVLIQCSEGAFELRHQLDEGLAASDLESVSEKQLADLVSTNLAGAFRPLKSAPDLRQGWRAISKGPNQLWKHLNLIYPGAVGDWFRQRTAPTSHLSYREFVGRQSGMYRGASRLAEKEADQLSQACCSDKHCLKERLWSIEPEATAKTAASFLLCREPCQLLLELARRMSKSKQENVIKIELPKSEAEALIEILRQNANQASHPDQRIADFSKPDNPRRLNLLIQALESQFARQKEDLRE